MEIQTRNTNHRNLLPSLCLARPTCTCSSSSLPPKAGSNIRRRHSSRLFFQLSITVSHQSIQPSSVLIMVFLLFSFLLFFLRRSFLAVSLLQACVRSRPILHNVDRQYNQYSFNLIGPSLQSSKVYIDG